jgi:hypothetical protein
MVQQTLFVDEVKRELKALDRQYSYENTVQLGRYHKDTEDEEGVTIRERRSSEQKKSVRFHGKTEVNEFNLPV